MILAGTVLTGIGIDSNAQAFITAAGITDTSQIIAINTLVLQLKEKSIWPNLQAVWPMIGGTSTTMKWNLINPVDSDAAYRMNFVGAGWTFDANGVKQSSSNTTYGDTFYAANTNNNTLGMSMGVYINGGTNAVGYDLGRYNSSTNTDTYCVAGYGDNIFYMNYDSTSNIQASGYTMPNGFFAVNNDGTNTKGYRNGANVVTSAESRPLTDSGSYYLGARHDLAGVTNGSNRRYAFAFMGKSLSATNYSDFSIIVNAYQTALSRNVYDNDAQAFITAAGITDPTQQAALNKLVLDLKSYNIWSKLQAVWPMVGGTSSTMKWNLVNPVDSDAAYRMTFTGAGWTFNSSGVKQSDSATTYGDTFYAVNTNNNTDGMSMGVYINGGTNAAGYDLGRYNGTDDVFVVAGYSNNTYYVNYVSTTDINTSAYVMPNGFFASNNDGTTTIGYRNGVNVCSAAETRNLTDTASFYLGNRNGGPAEPSDRRYAFVFMSKSLSATNHSDLYTAVQAYQTSLSRNV